MRNSIARIVLPQPGPPQISVGRPLGSPPAVISSSPWIPVGALGTGREAAGRFALRGGIGRYPFREKRNTPGPRPPRGSASLAWLSARGQLVLHPQYGP